MPGYYLAVKERDISSGGTRATSREQEVRLQAGSINLHGTYIDAKVQTFQCQRTLQ